jgi:hypothetical protein
VPLWDLIRESERIVVAQVQRIERREELEVAVLRVLENWKGPFTDLVRVGFSSGMICPAPPRYIEGQEVLAFLQREEDNRHEDLWWTVGLSYGTLYPQAEDRQHFWRLVHRLQVEGPSPSLEFQRDWHVEAAARRSTRWHGLFGIFLRFDSIHIVYDRRGERLEFFTPAELESIARGFLEEPSNDVTFPMTLDILRDFESAEIDATAVALVEGLLLRDPPPFWTMQSMRLVMERFGDPKAVRRRLPEKPNEDPIFDFLFPSAEAEELREIWALGRNELDIPSVEPLVLKDEEVEGVGPLTPP